MPSKYWIKLYHEILDDPKMGRLPDRLWRRAIEIFLLAGETDEDGILPPVADMAWKLRISEQELEQDLIALAADGTAIVTPHEGRWFVTKFSDRQAAVPSTERVQRFRERKRQEEYRDNVPGTRTKRDGNEGETNRSTDTDTESDTDTDDSLTGSKEPPPTPPPKPKTPKQQEAQATFSALANICSIDWHVCTDEQRGALNQTEKFLREKTKATPDDIAIFGRWWYEHDWRGKKGEAPEPHQVREQWGRCANWRKQNTPQGEPDEKPPKSDADILRDWWHDQLYGKGKFAPLEQFKSWLKGSRVISRQNGTVTIMVPNAISRERLSTPDIRAKVEAALGGLELEIVDQ